MTYQIWTRLIIASLILLGDSAVASEIKLRNNIETVTSDSIVQISQSESHDDIDHSRNPVIKDARSIQNQVARKYQVLLTLVYLDASSYSYELYHSRAPPVLSRLFQ